MVVHMMVDRLLMVLCRPEVLWLFMMFFNHLMMDRVKVMSLTVVISPPNLEAEMILKVYWLLVVIYVSLLVGVVSWLMVVMLMMHWLSMMVVLLNMMLILVMESMVDSMLVEMHRLDIMLVIVVVIKLVVSLLFVVSFTLVVSFVLVVSLVLVAIVTFHLITLLVSISFVTG